MAVEVAPYSPRTVLETLLPDLPSSETLDDFNDATALSLVESLSTLNESLLTETPLWRDTFALTGSLRSFYTPAKIIEVWKSTCATRQCQEFSFTPGQTRPVQIGPSQWIDVQFTFNLRATPPARCRGVLSLISDSQGTWKIWMIRTVLDDLEGEQSVDKITWIDSKEHISDKTSRVNGAKQSPEIHNCVIVGGGQAGLSTAGRLQALGITSYILLERNRKIGDSWMHRYDSTKLHTPREYSHLPFDRTFTGYQEYLTKFDLAKGHQDFARRSGVDEHIWLGADLEAGSWDDQDKSWTLQVRQGDIKTVRTRNIVMAVGACGQTPVMPNLPGRLDFQGLVLHSADYKSPEAWKGKAGVVVGTANTAHDVAQDMVEAKLPSVTMVQRARTFVVPVENYKYFSDFSYNTTIPTSEADFESMSTPYAVARLIASTALAAMAKQDPARFDALEAAGFRVERYGDIWYHLCERGGGHYVDVGCSKLISDGAVSHSQNLF